MAQLETFVDADSVHEAISEEYKIVAQDPGRGFHFHTGRRLTLILGYTEAWLEGIPEASIESFAGTGNPFTLGNIVPGENVVDVGSGAGIDSLIAARMSRPDGQVVGVDMTPEMLEKAQGAAVEAGLTNVEFRSGYAEKLPVEDGWADVVISNGVLNLVPAKAGAMEAIYKVLKPGGRLQIADILV